MEGEAKGGKCLPSGGPSSACLRNYQCNRVSDILKFGNYFIFGYDYLVINLVPEKVVIPGCMLLHSTVACHSYETIFSSNRY